MDCRDIKEEPLKITNGKYLEEIYTLQKGLLDHYVGIEGLPPYPVDVNTKASQTLLKDFTGRVTEELAEGYESYDAANSLSEGRNYFRVDMFEDESQVKEDYNLFISHIQNFNEEMADAMHFLVELLIYANIQPEDIEAYIHNNSHSNTTSDIIELAANCGKHSFDELMPFHPSTCHFHPKKPDDVANPLLKGGSAFSVELIESAQRFLWQITFELNMARNCLKNKPWKQTGVITNEVLYQECLVRAFIVTMAFFSLMGLESEDIYYLYFKKNKVNCFRISSKY